MSFYFFTRITLTCTFITWSPLPLKVPRIGAASLASRPNETAICCSPHHRLFVGSRATQCCPGSKTSTQAWLATEPTTLFSSPLSPRRGAVPLLRPTYRRGNPAEHRTVRL